MSLIYLGRLLVGCLDLNFTDFYGLSNVGAKLSAFWSGPEDSQDMMIPGAERYEHIGPGPNVVQACGLVSDGVQRTLVLPRAHCSLHQQLAAKKGIPNKVFLRRVSEALNDISHLQQRVLLHALRHEAQQHAAVHASLRNIN